MNIDNDNRRVLIVDDNQAIHDDIRAILEAKEVDAEFDTLAASLLNTTQQRMSFQRKYEIDSALQGEEGFQAVQRSVAEGRPYALAFIDMRMPPGWDGLRTIVECRKVDPQLQVVICTAYSDYSWQNILEEVGAGDWLLILKKPFDVVEVQQLACSLTEKWNLAGLAHAHTRVLEDSIRARSEQLQEANTRLQDQVESLAEANSRLAREIAARHMADQQIRHLAFHDSLTDLPNRVLLLERIEGCIERSKRNPDHKFAILYCDLDNFKLINDSLGHRIGDQFLVQTSRRLSNTLRGAAVGVRAGYDTVARLGGDEFVILLDDLPSAGHADAVAAQVREAMSGPMSVEHNELVLGVSIGIAVSSGEYDDPAEILRDADTALYHAKEGGKGQGAVFDQAMRDRVTERLDLEFELRRAIRDGEFEVFYQPIISLQDNRLAKAEALVRWNHPTRGMQPPDLFIPVAEETGMIEQIGAIVLDEAARQIAEWRKHEPALADLKVSVNLSPRQLTSDRIVTTVEKTISRYQLDPQALALEITESGSMDNLNVVREITARFQELGVAVHLDDFGTGYSSLSILHSLPFSTIKLDRSFINNLLEEVESATTIWAVVMIAQAGKLEVVAEGIETYQQLVKIRDLGCDYGQGYFMSKPLPAADFEAFCRTKLDDQARFMLPSPAAPCEV
ncbi:GGDEF/EAL domain-containing response regulator [Posidoniimonas polymericola]|nr:EAL domain-containing protein [Posidoniimonas polymericola]